MADVEAIVLIAGEVRQVEKKRDFTDRETGEVRVGKGRRADVLTYGGFIKLSIPEAFDGVEIAEGQVILAKAKVLPWVIPGRRDAEGHVSGSKHGTAFVFDGLVTTAEVDALLPALAQVSK